MSKTAQRPGVEPAEAIENKTVVPDPRQGIRVAEAASASAPLIFFDRAAFYALQLGSSGSLTLVAERVTADANGMATRENVIVAHLRAPMEALRQLRHNINEIEKAEAALAAAVVTTPPGGMAH